MPSAEVTAWKADRRLAAWLAERRKKDAARRLGTIRRAHRDLDWVIERRKAQIAATRRDAKNDKERKAAFEAASRERRAELAVAIPADPRGAPDPRPRVLRRPRDRNAASERRAPTPPKPPTRSPPNRPPPRPRARLNDPRATPTPPARPPSLIARDAPRVAPNAERQSLKSRACGSRRGGFSASSSRSSRPRCPGRRDGRATRETALRPRRTNEAARRTGPEETTPREGVARRDGRRWRRAPKRDAASAAASGRRRGNG